MPVGVIDVGSNTVRLKVAHDGEELVSDREMLRLGAEVEEHGRISEPKLAETIDVVRRFAHLAREHGATELDILITSPGRQAENGDGLRDALALAGACDARVLSSVDEGLLAFTGALSVSTQPAGRLVAVVDVGGGSAQVVVGSLLMENDALVIRARAIALDTGRVRADVTERGLAPFAAIASGE